MEAPLAPAPASVDSEAVAALVSRDKLGALLAHFPRLPAFTPVVHVLDEEQTLRNVALAVEAGADGVWLISHGRLTDAQLLHELVPVVRAAHPLLFLGVNCLSMSSPTVFEEVCKVPCRIDGVWSDSMGVQTPEQSRAKGMDPATAPQHRAERFLAGRAAGAAFAATGGLSFGGISFKYIDDDPHRSREDEQLLIDLGCRYTDVLTSSGPGTGLAMDAAKARALRGNAGGVPTAVASGVGMDNVDTFRGFFDVFLVASSCQGDSFEELDAAKVKALAAKIHSFREA
jgi:hypothetical protein